MAVACSIKFTPKETELSGKTTALEANLNQKFGDGNLALKAVARQSSLHKSIVALNGLTKTRAILGETNKAAGDFHASYPTIRNLLLHIDNLNTLVDFFGSQNMKGLANDVFDLLTLNFQEDVPYPATIAEPMKAIHKALVFGTRNRESILSAIDEQAVVPVPEVSSENEIALLGEVTNPATAETLLKVLPKFAYDAVYNVTSDGLTMAAQLTGNPNARFTVAEALHPSKGYLSQLLNHVAGIEASSYKNYPDTLSKLGIVFKGNANHYFENEAEIHELYDIVQALSTPAKRTKIFGYLFPSSQESLDEVISDEDLTAETVGSKLSEHIDSNDTKSVATKMSSTVKGFTSTFVYDGNALNSKFVYSTLLRAFNGVDLSGDANTVYDNIKKNIGRGFKLNPVQQSILNRLTDILFTAQEPGHAKLKFINGTTKTGKLIEGAGYIAGEGVQNFNGVEQLERNTINTETEPEGIVYRGDEAVDGNAIGSTTRLIEDAADLLGELGDPNPTESAVEEWDRFQAQTLWTDLVVHFGSQTEANYKIGLELGNNNFRYVNAVSKTTSSKAKEELIMSDFSKIAYKDVFSKQELVKDKTQAAQFLFDLTGRIYGKEAVNALQSFIKRGNRYDNFAEFLKDKAHESRRAIVRESLEIDERSIRANTVTDAKGEKRYKFFNGSYAYHNLKRLQEDNPAPAYKTPFMQANPFVSNPELIRQVNTHVGAKSEDRTKFWGYTDSSPKRYWERVFNQYFLASKERNVYEQPFGILADRPRTVSIQTPILQDEAAYKGRLQQILDQLKLRPDFTGSRFLKTKTATNNYDLTHVYNALNGRNPSEVTASDIFDGYMASIQNEIDAIAEDMSTNGVEFTESDLTQWVINSNLNGYFVNQLITGDQAYFKNQADVLKRIALAFSPGERGYVGPGGLKPTYRAAIIEDLQITKETLSEIFNETNSPNLREELGEKGADYTDAQSFILPERFEDLQAGYGIHWNMSTILKPIHYGLEVMGDQAVPVALKQSAVVLSDDLLLNDDGTPKYPDLIKLRDQMRASNVQEALFNTAVKLGNVKPAKFGEQIDEGSVLELDQNNYLLQMNPSNKLDKKVTAPSQMMYFLNVFHDGSKQGVKNKARADKVYKATGKLIGLQEQNYTDSSVNNNRLKRSKVLSSLKSSGERGFRDTQLMQGGLTYNMPYLSGTVERTVLSSHNKNISKVSFPGTKLVLQSPVGTVNPQTGERLQYREENGQMYAEVLVPKALSDQIKVDDHVVDMFGFRIPSTELHSGIPLKVVGYTEATVGANVIVAPQEIVPIHGSDFDVDSLFVIRREYDANGDVIGYKDGQEIAGFEKALLDSNTPEAKKMLEKFYKNQISNTFIDILSDMDNIQRMSKPISLQYLNNTLKTLGKTSKQSFDLATALGNRRAFEAIMAGRSLTGIFANSIKVYAYLQHSNADGGPAKLKDLSLNIGGKTFDTIQQNEPNGQPIVDTLDALVNAAIDNAKELLLDKLNATNATGNLYAGALSLGVPFDQTVMLLSNSYVKSLTDKGRLTPAIFAEELKNLGNVSVNENAGVSAELLEKAYKKPKSLTTQEKAQLLFELEKLNRVGNAFFTLSKALNILRNVPVRYSELTETKRVWEQIGFPLEKDVGPLENNDFLLTTDSLLANQPHIAANHTALINTIEVLRGTLVKHNPLVEQFSTDIADDTGINLGENRTESVEGIKNEFMSYLMSGAFSDLPNNWLTDTLNQARKLINGKEYASNSFVKILAIQSGGKGDRIVTSLDSNDVTEPILLDLQNAFKELPADIQSRFAAYSVLLERSGGFNNLAAFIPVELFKAANNRLEASIKKLRLSNNSEELDKVKEHFELQLVARNVDSLPWVSKKRVSSIKRKSGRLNNGVHYDLLYKKKTSTPEEVFKKYIQIKDTDIISGETTYTGYRLVYNQGDTYAYQKINDNPNQVIYKPYAGLRGYNVSDMYNAAHYNVTVSNLDTTSITVPKTVEVGDIVRLSTKNDITKEQSKLAEVANMEGRKAEVVPLDAKDTGVSIIKRPERLIQRNRAAEINQVKKTLGELGERIKNRMGFINEVQILDSEQMKTVSGESNIKGYYKDGNIYINYETASLDTLFHEVAHPIIGAIRGFNPENWSAVKDEINSTKAYQNIHRRTLRLYPNLDSEAQYEETAAEILGRYAAGTVTLKQRIKELWLGVRDFVRSLLGRSNSLSLADMTGLTLEELGKIIGTEDGPSLVLPAQLPKTGGKAQLDDLINRANDIIPPTEDIQQYQFAGQEYSRVSNFKENFIQYEKEDVDPNQDPIMKRAESQVDKMVREQGATGTILLDGRELQKDEAIKRVAKKLEQGLIRGKIIHKLVELQLAKVQNASTVSIQNELNELYRKAELSPRYYNWIVNPENFAKLMIKSGSNILAETDPQYRDRIASEVKVGDTDMGVFGTIDQLVEHADGYYSITDYKTGVNFNSKLYSNLMKYGNQAIDIHANSRDEAKFQVMMYALLVKASQPDAKFRDLRVLHIPNEDSITNKANKPIDVEVSSYLNMIEMYYKNEQPEIYAKLLEKSPNLFNPSHYSATDGDLLTELKKSNQSPRSFLDTKQAELQAMIARRARDGNDSVSSAEITKLANEIAELRKRNGLELNLTEQDAVSLGTRWLGTLDDVNDGYIKTYKKVLDEQTLLWQRDVAARTKELHRLMKAAGFKQGKTIAADRLMSKDSEKLWEFAWQEHTKTDESSGDSYSYRSLVTPQDNKWSSLTQPQRDLVEYLRAQFKDGIDVLDALGVREEDGSTKTKLELWQESKNFPFEYSDDFVPRVPITEDEMRRKLGGRLSSKYIKYKTKAALSDFIESTYEDQNEATYGLRVKYMGNPQINSNTEYYSDNLEVAFDRFMRQQLGKKYLDEVYALGKGLEVMYGAMEKGDGTNIYKHTQAMLKDKIKLDLLGEENKEKLLRKGFALGTNPVTGKTVRLDFFKLVRTLKSAVAAPIMWLQLPNATVNAAVANFMAGKDGLVGSIGTRFAGVSNNSTSYTSKNFFAAEAEITAMAASQMRGNKSKAQTLIENFQFMPTNYDWAAKSSEYLSLNKTWVNQSDMYMFHTLGEEFVAGVTMIAQMKSLKINKPGHAFHGKSVYEMYDKDGVWKNDPDTGKPFVRGVQELPSGETQEITGLTSEEINRLYRVYQRMQGGYRGRERTAIEAYLLGQVVMQFRRWLPSFLKVNFGSKFYDESLGSWELVRGPEGLRRKNGEPMLEWVPRMQEGRWRTLGRHLGNWLGFLNSPEYRWENLSDQQKLNVIDGYVTGAMFGLFSMVALGVKQGLDLDEDDPYLRMMQRTINRSTEFYNPIELVNNITSVPPTFSQSLRFMKASWESGIAMTALMRGDNETAFTQQGRLRGSTQLIKSLPFLNSAYHLNQFIVQSDQEGDSDIAELLGRYRN